MKAIVTWVGLIVFVIGTGVGIEAALEPGDPFGGGSSGSDSGFSHAYVGTPYNWPSPVIVTNGSAPVRITAAWVPNLPAGLTAIILATPSGDYKLNCLGCPGDLRKYHPDEIVPLGSVTLRVGDPAAMLPTNYEQLQVVLTPHHLGTFHIDGYDVAWLSEGHTGVHFVAVGLTLYTDRTGPDPSLNSPGNPYGPGWRQ